MKSKNIIIMLFSFIIISSLFIYNIKTTKLANEVAILKNENEVILVDKKNSIVTLDNDALLRNDQIQTIKNEIIDLEILYKEKELEVKLTNESVAGNKKSLVNLELLNLDKENKINSIKQEQKIEKANVSRQRIQLNPDIINEVILIATKNQFNPSSQDITYDPELNIASVFNQKETYKLLAVGPKVFVLTFSNQDTISLVQSIDLSNKVISMEQVVNIVAGE